MGSYTSLGFGIQLDSLRDSESANKDSDSGTVFVLRKIIYKESTKDALLNTLQSAGSVNLVNAVKWQYSPIFRRAVHFAVTTNGLPLGHSNNVYESFLIPEVTTPIIQNYIRSKDGYTTANNFTFLSSTYNNMFSQNLLVDYYSRLLGLNIYSSEVVYSGVGALRCYAAYYKEYEEHSDNLGISYRYVGTRAKYVMKTYYEILTRDGRRIVIYYTKDTTAPSESVLHTQNKDDPNLYSRVITYNESAPEVSGYTTTSVYVDTLPSTSAFNVSLPERTYRGRYDNIPGYRESNKYSPTYTYVSNIDDDDTSSFNLTEWVSKFPESYSGMVFTFATDTKILFIAYRGLLINSYGSEPKLEYKTQTGNVVTSIGGLDTKEIKGYWSNSIHKKYDDTGALVSTELVNTTNSLNQDTLLSIAKDTTSTYSSWYYATYDNGSYVYISSDADTLTEAGVDLSVVPANDAIDLLTYYSYEYDSDISDYVVVEKQLPIMRGTVRESTLQYVVGSGNADLDKMYYPSTAIKDVHVSPMIPLRLAYDVIGNANTFGFQFGAIINNSMPKIYNGLSYYDVARKAFGKFLGDKNNLDKLIKAVPDQAYVYDTVYYSGISEEGMLANAECQEYVAQFVRTMYDMVKTGQIIVGVIGYVDIGFNRSGDTGSYRNGTVQLGYNFEIQETVDWAPTMARFSFLFTDVFFTTGSVQDYHTPGSYVCAEFGPSIECPVSFSMPSNIRSTSTSTGFPLFAAYSGSTSNLPPMPVCGVCGGQVQSDGHSVQLYVLVRPQCLFHSCDHYPIMPNATSVELVSKDSSSYDYQFRFNSKTSRYEYNFVRKDPYSGGDKPGSSFIFPLIKEVASRCSGMKAYNLSTWSGHLHTIGWQMQTTKSKWYQKGPLRVICFVVVVVLIVICTIFQQHYMTPLLAGSLTAMALITATVVIMILAVKFGLMVAGGPNPNSFMSAVMTIAPIVSSVYVGITSAIQQAAISSATTSTVSAISSAITANLSNPFFWANSILKVISMKMQGNVEKQIGKTKEVQTAAEQNNIDTEKQLTEINNKLIDLQSTYSPLIVDGIHKLTNNPYAIDSIIELQYNIEAIYDVSTEAVFATAETPLELNDEVSYV